MFVFSNLITLIALVAVFYVGFKIGKFFGKKSK